MGEPLIITPPMKRFRKKGGLPSIFLAGSIEMGAAEDWQAELIEFVKPNVSVIYNPRRPDWDAAWAQEIDSAPFNSQVNWELDMLAEADVVALYFDPATKAPISLQELGMLSILKPDAVIVCCPEGFWRRGNVQIMCERVRMKFTSDKDSFEEAINNKLLQTWARIAKE